MAPIVFLLTRILTPLVAVLCLFAAHSAALAQAVVINEFMAANRTSALDDDNHAPDWIELYNTTASPINLNNWALSDDELQPGKFRLPDVTIPAYGHLLVWASDKNRFDLGAPTIHLNFKLNSAGESILLSDASLALVDRWDFGKQLTDVSFGRTPSGSGNWAFFQTSTPGAANSSSGWVGPLLFTPAEGPQYFATAVSITSQVPGVTIRYELDGGVPTGSSPIHSSPISVNDDTVIRAQGSKSGLISSDIETRTYFFNSNTSLPVMTVILEPEHLWNPLNWGNLPTSGIYYYSEYIRFYVGSGYDEDPVSLAYWEADGTPGFRVDAGMRMHGGSSRTNSTMKKSFRFYFRSEYGPGKLEYPLFAGTNVDRFDKLVLRANYNDGWAHGNGGDSQAALATYMRDEIMRRLRMEMGDRDVLGKYCFVYLTKGDKDNPNIGDLFPWGVYNLVEYYDINWLEDYFGHDDWDLIKFFDVSELDPLPHQPDDPEEGDLTAWNDFLTSYTIDGTNVNPIDYTNQANFDALAGDMDIENYTNYMILNMWAGNVDWPHQNGYAARMRGVPGAKWFFLDWDSESVLGGGGTGSSTLGRNVDFDAVVHCTRSILRISNLLRLMLANPGYRDYFAQRTDVMLNTVIDEPNVLAHVDELAAVLRPAMPFEEVWTWKMGSLPGTSGWEWALDQMETWINGRNYYVREHIRINSLFPNVTGWTDVTINSPGVGGKVLVQTIDPPTYPWTGTFFTGVPLTLEAVPDPGYAFTGWSDSDPSGPQRTFTLAGPKTVTASFGPDGQGPTLLNAQLARRDLVILDFDRPLNSIAALYVLSNYTIDHGVGNPSSAEFVPGSNQQRVLLHLDAPLEPATVYTLTVQNLSDTINSVPMTTQQRTLSFTTPAISITEIMYNNRGEDIEWIELFNTTDASIDLSGWYLTDDNSYPATGEGNCTIPAGTTLDPGEYLILDPWNQQDFQYWQMPEGVRIVHGITTDPGALNNGGDNLALFDAASGGSLVEGSLTVDYPDLTVSGESIEKIDAYFPWGTADTIAYNFRATTTALGFPTGEDDFGLALTDYATPGRSNGSPYQVQDLAMAWVDFLHAGSELGTEGSPFNTLAEAIAALLDGGTIQIKPGNSIETMRITKPMRIEASGGAVRIGN